MKVEIGAEMLHVDEIAANFLPAEDFYRNGIDDFRIHGLENGGAFDWLAGAEVPQ